MSYLKNRKVDSKDRKKKIDPTRYSIIFDDVVGNEKLKGQICTRCLSTIARGVSITVQ